MFTINLMASLWHCNTHIYPHTPTTNCRFRRDQNDGVCVFRFKSAHSVHGNGQRDHQLGNWALESPWNPWIPSRPMERSTTFHGKTHVISTGLFSSSLCNSHYQMVVAGIAHEWFGLQLPEFEVSPN